MHASARYHNTAEAYGLVTRTFHWLTALLILTAFPLGVIANEMAYDTGEQLAQKAWLFSIHKTVGIAAFTVALLRILWAISQPKPAAMHGDRPGETFLAELVHWSLYASMVVVPLSGWVHHAATEGFAPILWPLGQNLPLVPKSEFLAEGTKWVHFIFTKVLALSIVLHIAGALKHAFVDRDGTLARMCFGTDQLPQGRAHKSRGPILAAFALYAAGIGASFALVSTQEHAAAPQLAEVASDWQVTEGSLGITVSQFGSAVTGSFAEWTAAIAFTEAAQDGSHGDVTVEIAIPSLTLGSVTNEALGADFFNAEAHPTARFTAQILSAEGDGYIAEGTLALRGAEVPVTLPFALTIEGDTAQMQGAVTLDRRDFGMGPTYTDESTVGFSVEVGVALTATRSGE